MSYDLDCGTASHVKWAAFYSLDSLHLNYTFSLPNWLALYKAFHPLFWGIFVHQFVWNGVCELPLKFGGLGILVF